MFVSFKGIRRQVLISIILYVGTIPVGFAAAWTGSIITKLKDPKESPILYNLSDFELSLVASLLFLGTIPGLMLILFSGPCLVGWLSNVVGRKPCLIGSGALQVISATLLATADRITTIYLGRILCGIAGASFTVTSLMYIGEIGSKEIRGILLIGIGICQTSGMVLLYFVGPFLSYFGTTVVGLALSVISTIGLIFILESPIFYILKGNDVKVREILEDMGRLEDAEKLLSKKNEYAKMSYKKDWLELFTIKCNRKAFFIVLTIFILQNCSGYMVVVLFSASIFQMAGSSVDANMCMIIIGCFQLSGSILSSIFIERAGRKIILTLSTLSCALTMLILGVYFYLNYIQSAVVVNLGWLPLLTMVIYFIAYDVGFGVVPNVLIGEMFTSNVRSKGSSLAMSVAWLFGFAVNTGFGSLVQVLGGHYMFWFFSCICACAFFFTVFFIPETKGKSLLEIQELLNEN